MLIASLMLIAQTSAEPSLASPLAALRCEGGKAEAVDVTICGKRRSTYRIEPRVLAADRIVENRPTAIRNNLRDVTTPSCHDEPKKCEGRKILPLLPVALKTLEVATLAAQGQDWRAALRTRPDGWEAYQNAAKRTARPKICVGFCGRR